MTISLGQSTTPRLTIRRAAGLLRQEPAAPRLTVSGGSRTLVVRMPGRGPAGPPGPAGPVLAERFLIDDLSPQFNGSTQNFTLTVSGNPYPVPDPLSLEVIIGGIQQRPGLDYSVEGAVIRFTFSPRAGLTSLIIGTSYQRSSEGLPPGGASGQVLTKTGPGDRDLTWAAPGVSQSYVDGLMQNMSSSLSLRNLTDVTVSNPTEGSVLYYQLGSQKFVANDVNTLISITDGGNF